MNTLTVTRTPLADKPISPLLYGGFIELGYGVQTEPMTVELLFNRSFERIPPYKEENKNWFDLFPDGDHSKGYATDWSRFDWYHAGYEHNAWFAAPNVTRPTPIADESDFLVPETPFRRMTLRYAEGVVHGESSLIVESREPNQRCGLAQRGIYLREGVRYDFYGYVRALSGDGEVAFALVPEGKWDQPVFECARAACPDEMGRLSFSFVSGYTGYCSFVMWLERAGSVQCDAFSLQEGDGVGFWRKAVVDALKTRVKPTLIRWPGGCFASFYTFRDAIGPREGRKPVPSYYWGGMIDNDVGSLELASLCEALGAEQMVCVNMFHPLKRRFESIGDGHGSPHGYDLPDITDEQAGLRNVRDWVEYLNGSAATPMGALRAAHGHPKPFGVKYFELENEGYRWFAPEEYAHACVKYANAIHEVDPDAQVGMITYHTFGERLETLLSICGSSVNFLSDRDGDEPNLAWQLSVMRAYNREHNAKLFYVNPEWLPYVMHKKVTEFNLADGNKSYWFSKWLYAMNVFRQLMMWQRAGGDVRFVCFNNMANTHAQNTVDTPPDGAYVSASGCAMGFMAESLASAPLAIADYTPHLEDELQAQAALDASGEKLVLYAFNLSGEAQSFPFDLDAFGAFRQAEIRLIGAPSLTSMNRQTRDEISIDRFPMAVSGPLFTLDTPPYAFCEAVLSR